MFDTPILVLVFNRLEPARKVFDVIKVVKPSKLFIAADGPRNGYRQDVEKCRIVREEILKMVDWSCDLKTLFRDVNYGCGKGPSDAITWFFNHVSEGIILEDDCLPDSTFFPFCQTLLNHYRNVPRVMHISGDNFQYGVQRGHSSYYFSAFTHSWGWATWRDRWENFNFKTEGLNFELSKRLIQYYGFTKEEVAFWQRTYEDLQINNRDDVWDFQWMLAVWKNGGVAVIPQVNLVRNIGFGADATHTNFEDRKIEKNVEREINQIHHPEVIAVDFAADRFVFNTHFSPTASRTKGWLGILKLKIRKVINRIWLPLRFRQVYQKFSSYTMIPKAVYISNLALASRFGAVRGDVVECGTWKGGMIAGMTFFSGRHKTYHLFDSFEGLPPANEIDGSNALNWQADTEGSDYFDNCKAALTDAQAAMAQTGVTYKIYKGWFKDTLHDVSFLNGISILRLDADWYDSTKDCLEKLFPHVNPGGVVILDDYYKWDGCSRAVHNYLARHSLPFRINNYRGVCYIVKSST